MSTEIESELKEHMLVEFGKKDKGVCLQVTTIAPDDPQNGYIQLA